MGVAAALLISAVITGRAYGLSSFIIAGFVIYCMSIAINGLRQGEIEAAENEEQEAEEQRCKQFRRNRRD